MLTSDIARYFTGIYGCQKTSIVRVGGRSNSEILKQFTLRELRNKREFRRTLPMHLRRAYMNVSHSPGLAGLG